MLSDRGSDFYDKEFEEYTLDFPNNEVRRSFVTLMSNSYISSVSRTVDEWIVKSIKKL